MQHHVPESSTVCASALRIDRGDDKVISKTERGADPETSETDAVRSTVCALAAEYKRRGGGRRTWMSWDGLWLGSNRTTWLAPVMLRPVPPAMELISSTKEGSPGELNLPWGGGRGPINTRHRAGV